MEVAPLVIDSMTFLGSPAGLTNWAKEGSKLAKLARATMGCKRSQACWSEAGTLAHRQSCAS
eukprot:14280577-Alexandrium_andersonii.AAC.1